MQHFTIREMEENDLKEAADVFLQTFRSVEEEWTQENSLQHIKESFFGDCHYVVIHDEKIVGILLAFPLTKVKGKELFVDTIVVLPEYQQQGVGRSLLQKAREYVKQNNLAALSLQANPTLTSFTWYTREGMKESGWVELYQLYDE